MSVWKGIDRLRFEAELDLLYRRGRFQEQSLFPALPASPQRRDSVVDPVKETLAIDCTTESQLADDFAVLASAANWPGDVAAAALHSNASGDGLCISIAANSGISQRVELLFRGVLRILELRAKGGTIYSKELVNRVDELINKVELKRPAAIDYMLDEIVLVHKDQIFGRMGSRKAEDQKKREADVLGRLKALIADLEKRAKRQTAQDESAALLKQLQTLPSFLTAAESADARSVEELSSIKHFICTAAELTTGEEKFASRLQRAGFRDITGNSRVVREIQAIGNYRRIASFAVEAAKMYKTWFQSTELNVVPVDPSLGPYSREKFYVHAEIQLILEFETKKACRPRYIGASKKPCFLCYCFIRALRAHMAYGIGRSHGEVFKHWTVPESAALDDQACKWLNSALRQTAEDIRKAPRLPKSPKASRWVFHPLQSVSKLLLDQRGNTSDSTLVSVVAVTKLSARDSHAKAPLKGSVSIGDFLTDRATPDRNINERAEIVSIVSVLDPCAEHASARVKTSEDKTECIDSHSTRKAPNMTSKAADTNRNSKSEQDIPTSTLCEHGKVEQLKFFDEIVTEESHPTYCDDALELFFEFEPGLATEADVITAAVKHSAGSCIVKAVSELRSTLDETIDLGRLDRSSVILQNEAESHPLHFVLRLEHKDYAVELRWI